jgi:hypothetical protein
MAALWEMISFQKQPKLLKIDLDYQLYNYPDSDLTGVRLLRGEYQDVIYYYGKVKFSELGEVGQLSFGFQVTHPGKHDYNSLQTDEKFVTIMGDILREILIHNEQTRTLNTEESDLQRGIHS